MLSSSEIKDPRNTARLKSSTSSANLNGRRDIYSQLILKEIGVPDHLVAYRGEGNRVGAIGQKRLGKKDQHRHGEIYQN